jgi:selenocysteine-specific elongation factor
MRACGADAPHRVYNAPAFFIFHFSFFIPMYVIGTAGHVDHGKSTLVKALTGIDPDRWEEEQRREMTIDLGFAWLTLPSGRTVSLIDVPGHERFIKNMLAGVGGLDAALLVIAADEAVMPQTAEHLAILDLLGVAHGVVVLSKADLVEPEWLALVQEDVAARLAGTSLADAPIVPVSARTGQGLDQLRAVLDQVLDQTPTRSAAQGAPRLPVDRSFTIGGFGTVVTGTLLDGPLHVGQDVLILPAGLPARVRGLQSHNAKLTTALPGNRVAVNLAGVHHSAIARGDVLALPGTLKPTQIIDLRLRVIPAAPQPIAQNTRLDLFVGAAEAPCRVTLLDAETLPPGATGWVQLRLERPVAVQPGDRCILRIPSPSFTVAGGTVVDAHPPRHRRFRAEVTARLDTLARGAPDELLLQALGVGAPHLWSDVLEASGMADVVAGEALATLEAQGSVIVLRADRASAVVQPSDVLLTPAGWAALEQRLQSALRAFHTRLPLRRGMPREDLRQRLRLPPRIFGPVLAEAQRRGLVAADAVSVWLTGHDPQPTPQERRALDAYLAAMARTPYGPPAPDFDAELLAWALERRLFIKVADDIYFLPATYAALIDWVRTTIASAGSVTVGQFRDAFGSSRKYALAFLEHLDERNITRRAGEGRILA